MPSFIYNFLVPNIPFLARCLATGKEFVTLSLFCIYLFFYFAFNSEKASGLLPYNKIKKKSIYSGNVTNLSLEIAYSRNYN